LAEAVPTTNSTTFKDSYIEYSTLHVPAASIESYRNSSPWNQFKTIVPLSGDDPETPVIPETPQCATPTISYSDGKLSFECATEGAEFISEITDTDINKHYDATISLSVTYNITVYATKAGYDNSETATATLCWLDASPSTEGLENGVAEIRATPILIQGRDGLMTVNGAADGTLVSVYSLSGNQAGTAVSRGGTAVFSTSLASGTVAIVKIGTKAMRVMVR